MSRDDLSTQHNPVVADALVRHGRVLGTGENGARITYVPGNLATHQQLRVTGRNAFGCIAALLAASDPADQHSFAYDRPSSSPYRASIAALSMQRVIKTDTVSIITYTMNRKSTNIRAASSCPDRSSEGGLDLRTGDSG